MITRQIAVKQSTIFHTKKAFSAYKYCTSSYIFNSASIIRTSIRVNP